MFYITISNGLLKDGHRKRMGEAVWEFMWLIDRVTSIDDQGYGKVLGGKPIKLDEIAEDLEVHRDTVSSNLIKLEEHGYIEKTRTPYGLSIRVVKAKKRFGGNAESNKVKTPNLNRENAESNKTIQLDNNNKTVSKDTAEYGNPDINSLVGLLKKSNHGILDGSDQENRRYCWLLLSKFGYSKDKELAKNTAEAVIGAACTDDFHAKNATSFKYLYNNAVKIMQSQKVTKTKVATV